MNCDTNGCQNEATIKQQVRLAQPSSTFDTSTVVHVCADHKGAMHCVPGLRVIKEVELVS